MSEEKNKEIMKNFKKNHKRRIAFIITSFIHYSRNFLVLEELNRRSDVDLHVILGGTALLSKYSSKYAHVRTMLEDSGIKNIYEMYFNLEGDNHVTKAKTTGLGVIEFSTLFNNLKPDLVVVRGDRFEVLSATIAAAYMNISIAHIEGGDLSGSIDESVRHAVTKLSHIHFATNEPAKARILKMGEHKKYVFNFGSPDVEVVHRIGNGKSIDLGKTGSGASIDPKQDYLMVMYHPVTNDAGDSSLHTKSLLKAVQETGMQTLWFWPNADVGTEEISRELRVFKDNAKNHKIHFMRYVSPKDFIWLLKNTRALIGNSSAGLKESSYLGVPVVNVGNRQSNRLRAENVVDVGYDPVAIKKAIEKQLAVGRYPVSHLYKAENTAKNIARTLATIDLYIQKSFVE